MAKSSAYDNPFDTFNIMSYLYNFPIYEEPTDKSIAKGGVKYVNCPKHNMKFIQICADINCPSEGL